MIDPVILAATCAAFLLAGFVKGVIGMGLPTVAIGLLSLVMPPAEAAAILILPSAITNLWQSLAGPSLKGLSARLAPLLLGAFLGTVGAALTLGAVDSPLATTALGGALALYGLVGLTPLRIAIPKGSESWLGPLAGAITGVISAATGVFTIPAVAYLQALNLDRDELVQALGLFFTVSTVALGVVLARNGLFQLSIAGASLAALAAALAGMALGQTLRKRTRQEVFRLAFFIGLLTLGLYLILKTT